MRAVISKLPINLIKAYRFVLSPWLGQQCRFHPTCSQYALQAVEQHGPYRGSWLAAKRLASCHPWHAGGIDPVPENHANK
ncbi:MAG: membrane protein insertion efficiency factor YidD [Gammaproteobacteria bacterium]|nr:MAG: membrane protein insertion efficiency factor YidD [Gammaproteobacteria bacterium]